MDLLRHCAAADHNPFSNGAGKQFVTELLCLSSVMGEHWIVRSSTTTNPTTDWCGVVPRGTEPKITGVVDIILKTVEGETLLLAEVKSRPHQNNLPNLQLLAELRMVQRRSPTKGIIGLLVDPWRIHLYLPQAKGARFGREYSVKSRRIGSFALLISAINATFGYIRTYSGKASAPPASQPPLSFPLRSSLVPPAVTLPQPEVHLLAQQAAQDICISYNTPSSDLARIYARRTRAECQPDHEEG